jgi:8-oxo-dGTP diphosphatase
MPYTYQYPRPSLTLDIILFSVNNNEISVLLIERGKYPFKGKWAFPGGFLDLDEELEAGARRELLEETGLNPGALEQFRSYGGIGRDPRGRTISVVFVKILEVEPPMPAAGDDAANAQWFSIHAVPELAFDHKLIFSEAIEKYFNIRI